MIRDVHPRSGSWIRILIFYPSRIQGSIRPRIRIRNTDTIFFRYADDNLNRVAAELDSFDGRKDPERCAALVSRLRQEEEWAVAPPLH
jgi:hypothetical protein